MKRYVVLLVLLMVLAPAPGVPASEESLPAKGTRQMVFGFSGWYLDQYKGGIGLRYYLGENTALRSVLDVGWSKDDDTGWDHNVYETQETRQSTYTTERSSYSVGLGTMLERHFLSSRKIVPFAGLGVFGWYDKSDSDQKTVSRRGTTVHAGDTVSESRGYTIEGILLAGLQWRFAPNMSLGGEYRIKLKYYYREYDWKHTDWDSHSTDHDSYEDYDLTVDSSQLWLAISF